MSSPDKKLRLCTFYYPPGLHFGGWRMPGAEAGCEGSFDHYVRGAQAAERGKMDAIFFQDTVAVGGSGMNDMLASGDPRAELATAVARLEPMTLLAALATVTSDIGLIATGTTTYNHPYHIARRFATIDLISRGRAGWNLVTSQVLDEAMNFGLEEHVEHGERYGRAEEFADVVLGLWDSWDEVGVRPDKASGRYFDASHVRMLEHVGKYFRVRGPLNVPRSPQGRPVIAQAGSSEPGKALAARTADLVFTAAPTIEVGQAFYEDLKGRLAAHGRRREDLKILPGLMPIVGGTMEEAQRMYRDLRDCILDSHAVGTLSAAMGGGINLNDYDIHGPLPELPSANTAKTRQLLMIDMARRESMSILELGRRFVEGAGHLLVIGTPESFADMMADWLAAAACDGFMITPPFFPGGLDDFVDGVIPELQVRGLFRTEYEGGNLRENLGVAVPRTTVKRKA